MSRQRWEQRRLKLQQHHAACERRYETAANEDNEKEHDNTQRLIQVRQELSHLMYSLFLQRQRTIKVMAGWLADS